MANLKVSGNGRYPASIPNKALYGLNQHWLLASTLILLIFVGLPWLHPSLWLWAASQTLIKRNPPPMPS